MSIIKLYSNNPSDGTSTFDKVKWYEADDASGTNAAVITSGGSAVQTAIDATTTEPIHPGFTTYIYENGNTAKYYASTWYNSTTAIETDYSNWVQGGYDRWNEKFEEEMDDDGTVWSDDLVSEFKEDALNALFPDFFREVLDTSLTISNTTNNQVYVYTVPFGIFNVSEVGVGELNTDSSDSRNFAKVKADYWTFEKNKLHFSSLSGLTHGDTIRLIASKKYLHVGEVPEYLDSLIMLHMKMSAYLNLADDFPRFKTWARIQQGTKVSFENLRVHAREFERKFKEMKAELKNNAYSSLI